MVFGCSDFKIQRGTVKYKMYDKCQWRSFKLPPAGVFYKYFYNYHQGLVKNIIIPEKTQKENTDKDKEGYTSYIELTRIWYR
jgi:hypothetical protein